MIQPVSGAGGHAFHHDDGHGVLGVVQNEMNHRMLLFGPRVRRGQRGTIVRRWQRVNQVI
jgi:hypothetical protein